LETTATREKGLIGNNSSKRKRVQQKEPLKTLLVKPI
jgi:hypothetical protein